MAVNDPTLEKDLLQKLQEGSVSAFEEIYDRFKDPITRNLLAFLKDDDAVEDALQELFFRLWDKRNTLGQVQSLSNYLFRISANMAHDHFRKLERDRKSAASFWETWQAQESELDTPYRKELDEALYSVIDRLPPQRKKVFELCKMESKSYREVADMLNITIPAVKDHIIKANRFLKINYRNPDTQSLLAAMFAAQILKNII